MELEKLISKYPKLYHMASNGSWPSIKKHGLQSTRLLLDRYKIEGAQREQLLSRHRPESVLITHENLPPASIRDQKPMSDNALTKALEGTCKNNEWYELLNNKVFFWLTEDRLRRMLSAKAYRDSKHDVLTIDSESLIRRHEDKILLSPMNSGNTKPFPHPRRPEIFQKIDEFPFEERGKTRKLENNVVELTVNEAVYDIKDHVLDVRTISIDEL